MKKNSNSQEGRALDALIKLSRAADSVEKTLGRGLFEAGLTPSQFGALDALYHLGPLPQKTLCQKMLRTKGNLTLIAKNLEKKRWVKRKTDPLDARSAPLEITSEGKKIFERVFARHGQNARKAFSVLSSKELDQLAGALKKLGLAQNNG